MAENLNYKPNDSLNSWCYNDDDSSCEKYGRLYDWYAAVRVCPEGWHLPDSSEWSNLISIDKLKSKRGWNDYSGGKSGNGTDYFGFSALPGGVRTYSGKFLSAGDDGHWWTATETNQNSAYRFSIGSNYGDYVAKNSFAKYDGYSIRCVKEDDTTQDKFEQHSITAVTFRHTVCSGDKCRNNDNRHRHIPVRGGSHIPVRGGRDRRDPSPIYSYIGTSRISVTKTETGAFAKYESAYNEQQMEAELSMEEWQNFIMALYRCGIDEWEKENEEKTTRNILRWQLRIFYSDKIPEEFEGYGEEYPSKLRDLEKAINDLRAKIMEKSDAAKYKPLPSQIFQRKYY